MGSAHVMLSGIEIPLDSLADRERAACSALLRSYSESLRSDHSVERFEEEADRALRDALGGVGTRAKQKHPLCKIREDLRSRLQALHGHRPEPDLLSSLKDLIELKYSSIRNFSAHCGVGRNKVSRALRNQHVTWATLSELLKGLECNFLLVPSGSTYQLNELSYAIHRTNSEVLDLTNVLAFLRRTPPPLRMEKLRREAESGLFEDLDNNVLRQALRKAEERSLEDQDEGVLEDIEELLADRESELLALRRALARLQP